MRTSDYVVLFGSAAAGASAPRDLDLAIGGSYSEDDARRLAAAWWQRTREGLPLAALGFPVDPPPMEIHRQTGRTCYLLRPRFDANARYIVLAGEDCVHWTDVESLPAAIRLAADGQTSTAGGMMERIRCAGLGSRIPVSLAPYDKDSPIGTGGYDGDGPIALESALAKLPADKPLGAIIPSPFPVALNSLLTTIRACPGVWGGTYPRRSLADKGGVMEGLRHYWVNATPLGCLGYVGDRDVLFEYGRPVPVELVESIIVATYGDGAAEVH